MSLTELHRWCMQKIGEAFESIAEEDIQAFMRNEENKEQFDLFFAGEAQNRLFIFYQPSTVLSEDEDWTSETPPNELFLGDASVTQVLGKCCYFLRNLPSSVPLETSEPPSSSLLFGEIGPNALSSIENILSYGFKPLLQASDDWGEVSNEQKTEFLMDMDVFIENINEALTSLSEGLELSYPSKEQWKSVLATNASNSNNIIYMRPEQIQYFEGLLDDWCSSIETFLSQSTRSSSSSSSSSSSMEDNQEVGPRGELQFWRNRMQRLTSVTQQLKRPDCKQVIGLLSKMTKNSTDPSKERMIQLLRRWKTIDVNITESANEAKDNVKYLFTLERFIEPLYTGIPSTIIDTLPALMNSIKMIHTIARYYNTSERMTNLFTKITDQMILNCKQCVSERDMSSDALWNKEPRDLLRQLESCLKLNEGYREQYQLTKRKLEESPHGKQFDFNELQIFGKFDLFCRRVIKLIDLFNTIDQFTSLSENKLEGMEHLIDQFHQIVKDFKLKRHDLLDYHNNKFDRDYVEFNVKISDLEGALQQYINQSFENTKSIEHSLKLLQKFQSILQRESLKSDLDSKLSIIFQNYGVELETIQELYEKQKHDPPIPRNLPPVAGNIIWARHLLHRIEEPMKQFEANQNVLAGKEAKRIIKMYNRVAKTLVAFEYLWYQAWVQSIENTKAGLQATLIIRHPDDGKLYVNFDQEILQLIREAKCLDRIGGCEIPDAAKIVLFQEEKFKTYYNELHWVLLEYDRVVTQVIPVTAMVLRPHFKDMEFKLRPGMITLTWTSMNIDTYKTHVQQGLRRLEELVTNINDIIEHRIEKNLKKVSKTLLVHLPEEDSFTMDEFISIQEEHIEKQAIRLQGKNLEIEYAVKDLIKLIKSYALDDHIESVSEDEIAKIQRHYNHFMYQALLHCAKNSMNALKKRIATRTNIVDAKKTIQPFFEVDIELHPPHVVLHPSLDDIQECINRTAQAILRCFRNVIDWHLSDMPLSSSLQEQKEQKEQQEEEKKKKNFFDRITKDIEIVRVALLLTGCVQGIRNTVRDYLNSFSTFNWLWEEDKNQAYEVFMQQQPSLEMYADKLRSFGEMERIIDEIPTIHTIGALSLNTTNIKGQFKASCDEWKTKFSNKLHHQAQTKLESLTEYIRVTSGKLQRDVIDLDTLGFIMNLLKEIRSKESSINMEIEPVMDMYDLLEHYLPSGFMQKDEIDKKTILRTSWRKLVKQGEERTSKLNKAQGRFKRTLLIDIRDFKHDVDQFRLDFVENGPLVDDVDPNDAVIRLHRFKEEFNIRERKMELYRAGEELFALPLTDYPDLLKTKKELTLADSLFSLYTDVIDTLSEWKQVSWTQVKYIIDDMTEKMDQLSTRCKKLPGKLRDYTAYKQLKKQIEDFQEVLPILQELSKPSIMQRHWDELMELTNVTFEITEDFQLQTLLELPLLENKDDLEEITDGADKQLKIQLQLEEINSIWSNRDFVFQPWKDRPISILIGTGAVMEELEEAQMNLQAMLTMRHVTPFKEECSTLLGRLSDTSDTLERWLKVQMMWCSLESVFLGGDIAREMPLEAKKFGKVDKEWLRVMTTAADTVNVVECTENDILKTSLPIMYQELEKCQKSLEGYLEQKRNKFPRFYFVSNPGLLIILSQGSDPLTMNEHYEKVFDAIAYVEHNRKDKTIIEKIHGDGGEGHEIVPFSIPVKAQGNIEDWLVVLLASMQQTMKDICRNCAADIGVISSDVSQLRSFVDNYIAQFALLGIQLMWTYDVTNALEQCRMKKTAMKEMNVKQVHVLREMSDWCLQDLGSKVNRKKIETLVTIHVHQRDVSNFITNLYKQRKISDPNDFEWLKQARFYWQPNGEDRVNQDGASIISITDVDFNYQYEYLGSKERLVITPLTDRCYITLAQAIGMFYGGAPAGPAGTGKTETVKDLGRSLGIYVIVTNCTDQLKYTDCAKIFKGLCQSGLWGCFDEFNRIQLPVLSVVAQMVLSILNARKAGVHQFQFPGDPQDIDLIHACSFFITMNPGYAGRQELPENLKALFRGVSMMVPDFQIIIKVKLCSVGYVDFDLLAQKFFVLYETCKEQLSAQKHYDWGLRNILAVLRTAGQTKRDNLDKPEAFLLYRTLRDMNLSKLVAQDVPLFLSLLADLFPSIQAPDKGSHEQLEQALVEVVNNEKLVYHEGWVNKVIQLYEITLVRHGIMLVGPTGGGKSEIFKCLRKSLEKVHGHPFKEARLNPKSIRAQEMYGEIDSLSGEWTTGVFAAMWAKFNNRSNNYHCWIIADGPVDAIWIEDLNTVLDDNRILTLANGDRIPMTDNVKLMFEVETLVNASPATVSRVGIIYVSDTDLDWKPFIEGWVRKQHDQYQSFLRSLFDHWLGECTPTDVGHCIDFLNRNTKQVMTRSRVGLLSGLCDLLQGLMKDDEIASLLFHSSSLTNEKKEIILERLFIYSLIWSVGGLLEDHDRFIFNQWLYDHDIRHVLPSNLLEEQEQEEEKKKKNTNDENTTTTLTLYEYYIDSKQGEWMIWKPPLWTYPQTEDGSLDFSNLLVPTMDSTRSQYILHHLHKQNKPILMVGAEGTAKTSTALMYFSQLGDDMLVKRINFSSATTPFMCQTSIETELEKRGGRNFGPPGGKKMTIFIDDLSMPQKNLWGDQPTLEMVRLIVERSGFAFLDKDKRGDFKMCEDLLYVGAMQHPGGGKNDIPNRLKRNFFIFNLVLPSITSINDIYGQMLKGRFTSKDFDVETLKVVNQLTELTISLWRTMKQKMLPTPQKFHYSFNMRELSRVFQGILLTPYETIQTGGINNHLIDSFSPSTLCIRLWKHECDRVFQDKLTNSKDKELYQSFVDDLMDQHFDESLKELCQDENSLNMSNFFREDEYEDGVKIADAPKLYEPGMSLDHIRQRVQLFLNQYNDENPSKRMDLVLFDDALRHLLRINRLIEMPRGSALLVGVGGSGKQSLTRLASYISKASTFQIVLTKTYNVDALMEDIRELYKLAGHQRKQTTFLFTDSEIKKEVFLEVINSLLMTGDIPGLFAKDELMAITGDLLPYFVKDRPDLPETQDNLKQYFIDTVRDNLHVILCFSPMNPKFSERARKFPGLFSSPTIDWFLPWPEDALISVSHGFLHTFDIECDTIVKTSLIEHMGIVHKMVTEVCDEYYNQMRRRVYQTPKSYLSFIQNYKTMYGKKLNELKEKEERVSLGLRKLIQGASDVEAMKKILAKEQIKLEKATEDTNKMLASLEVSSAEAKKEGEKVDKIKTKCEEDATRISKEKDECQADLAKAQPFVDQAVTAISSIKPAHIVEVKKLGNPADIIKLVFDGVLILFMKPLNSITSLTLNVSKQEVPFIETSLNPHGVALMNDTRLLQNLLDFEKEKINEETIELLSPYLELEGFTPKVAKNASAAAEGLCTWVIAMKSYHEASKIVKPKLEALTLAQGQLDEANAALEEAQKKSDECNAHLRTLQDMFDTQMAEKKRIEDNANALQRKMEQASALINGLSGERERWSEDANNFASLKQRLVGDCAVACAFISYCGPFNQDYRHYLLHDKFTSDCMKREVPVTKQLDVIDFLVDIGTIGDWNLQGLPTDPLSIQNGILVTRNSRFPLLIDPQGQAVTWIRNKEMDRLPSWGSTTLSDPKLRDKLEFCMSDGLAFIVLGIQEDIDPMFDPVLEKQFIKKGKRLVVNVSDKLMDYDPTFMAYFITRLPNPNFSPELQAKTTVVDFTVTMKGLEEQLLGRVIGKEQKALEDQLTEVLNDVNRNTKTLMNLDASLLERLTSNEGDLLEDDQLIEVLGETKKKAAEVKAKLIAADETKHSINEKREQFRAVATRGSVLYFSIVEMSLVNCMYQTSLDQFLVLFMQSMDKADRANLASKRVANIIETMTYLTYRYVNRGLYEQDKLTFVLLITMKILVTSGHLTNGDITLFLRGGAALDINTVKRKPFGWMENDVWLNIIELSSNHRFFSSLINDIVANESMWRRWCEDNEPEQLPIPDYENLILENPEIGPFLRLLLVRMLRMDRCLLACKNFIRETKEMGSKYVEPVTDTIESIYDEMIPSIPVIFLLSIGADPTESIENLARKKKLESPAVISMGEGQEPVALRAIDYATQNGTWVLLQNCELGLDLMNQMEERIQGLVEQGIEEGFRLFITALPHSDFPLGLLQMSTKVTNEPPSGLKAGLLRSYTVMVDQERLERVETTQWRQLLFALCFMHSIVQERRKFGPLGWCIPYEYNNGDLGACIVFLEKHLYNGDISWSTFQYMVSEVQYGGKITDDLDRRLFSTYTKVWLSETTCDESFSFNPSIQLIRTSKDFNYHIPLSENITDYQDYLTTFPEIDSPEIFGLHPNADLTFRVKEVNELFQTLSDTQPKGGGETSDGLSREDVVYEKATEFLERLPEDYIEDEYKLRLQKLGGLAIPLNIFLFQEIQRLQRVIEKVRTTLIQLQLAIKGEVVMTDELSDAIDAIYDARVPTSWIFTVAGDEFSWIIPKLGLWFASLLQRDDQDRTWLNTGRPHSYWLTGFFNPQGILTAMKQEVTRKHKNDATKWALDDIVYHTEVTMYERPDHVRSSPQEGIYIHGLFLDGAGWNTSDTCLVEQEPKVLFCPLPVLYVTANLASEESKAKKELFGSIAPYQCPCYKYKARTDRYLIFMVDLKASAEKDEDFWTLRGVSLLCNTN